MSASTRSRSTHSTDRVPPLALILSLALTACAGGERPAEANLGVEEIRQYVDPPAVGSYPATEARINGWIDAGQQDSIRAHGWDLWESITTTTASGLPVWETWYSGYEVFTYTPMPPLPLERRAFRDFEVPEQHVKPGLEADTIPFDPREEVTAFNRFTESTAHYIWDNRLNRGDLLDDSLQALLAAGTPIAELQVMVSPDSTDERSIVLKPVFQFISGDSASLVPYWAGNVQGETVTDTLNPIVRRWLQGVWVDPTGQLQPGETRIGALPFGEPAPWPVVAIDEAFFHITLDSADAAAFSQYALISGDDVGTIDSTGIRNLADAVQPGAVALLMAMHLTGKEIPNWTWHTYWWSPEPDAAPYGDDRPSSITAPWDHYVQDAVYSMTDPQTGAANVVWNPYLESNLNGWFPDTLTAGDSLQWYGPQTNCMSCHRMASRSQKSGLAAPGYVPAMMVDPGDSIFSESLKTDFLWSLAGRAGTPADSAQR